jgi:Uma2 family endonuclease
MATVPTASRTKYPNIADVQARIGDVPVERIRSYPAPGTATEADLLDPAITGDRLCELVDGILVEKPMGFRESRLASEIAFQIRYFLRDHNLGVVATGDGPVRFRLGLVRMPDVSFIRWDSVDDPDDIEDPDGAFLEYPPDLAVEVLSPSNTRSEMAIKLGEYARAGVRLVWYVDPDRKEVTVYPRGKERGKKVRGLGGVLDGGEVLPGFTLPVAKIFEKRAPAKKGGRKGKPGRG